MNKTRTAILAVVLAAISGACQSGPHYATCDEARAAGVAPISKGEPGYRAALDRDGNGIACEVE